MSILGMAALSASAFDAKQFDLKDQRRVRRYYTAGAAGTVTELGRNDEGALATDLHRGDTFVPTGNDLPSANRKLERPATVDRAVELLALGAVLIEPAGVMHDASLTSPRAGAGADLAVDDPQAGGRRHGLSHLLGGCRGGSGAGAGAGQGSDESECHPGPRASKNLHSLFSCVRV